MCEVWQGFQACSYVVQFVNSPKCDEGWGGPWSVSLCSDKLRHLLGRFTIAASSSSAFFVMKDLKSRQATGPISVCQS